MDTGRAEDDAPDAVVSPSAGVPAAISGAVAAEDECGTAKNNADQREVQGDEQGGAERGVAAAEAGKEANEEEDQPDVVGLPDGAHGVGDGVVLGAVAPRAGGEGSPTRRRRSPRRRGRRRP